MQMPLLPSVQGERVGSGVTVFFHQAHRENDCPVTTSQTPPVFPFIGNGAITGRNESASWPGRGDGMGTPTRAESVNLCLPPQGRRNGILARRPQTHRD
ncbi:hypothetical protein SKAU_G00375340 [Synaphobranchus kaupii]|uniref:Uncharacterized protein n=1 Tax=Synaphobranchus kaupii TaxID=118154 RepID=A0A9Q1EGV1_SYNKA|nr:hypothetical protein SKAU_G00375340 [Synaphobranchus kaupii]